MGCKLCLLHGRIEGLVFTFHFGSLPRHVFNERHAIYIGVGLNKSTTTTLVMALLLSITLSVH